MTISTENIKQKAIELGFNLVGLTRAEPSPMLNAYHRWIEQGMHGKMGYLERPDRIIRREDLNNIVSNAQSIIMVGMDYRTREIAPEILHDPTRGRIANYAWGLDYHDILEPRLEQFAQWIATEAKGKIDHKVYVDTGAILERSHAQQAAMGFIGKNTMLIHPRRGSYFFLGEIITSLELDTYDEPQRQTMCGTCTRCLKACPTDAFPKPHILDARLCISYHTIENKGWIDQYLRSKFGNWVFGCDICQEVCPFQRFSPTAQEKRFFPIDSDRAAPPLVDLLTLDDVRFKAHYDGSPIYRVRRKRLVRNACIAAGNSHDSQFIPYLIQLLYDSEPLVRGHAAWGLWQIMGQSAVKQLNELYYREEDEAVRDELERLLA
ncbi:MAG: tRNA epoxyqueuosine(34) reductase QueG [Anaerolineae bacterium]|nr:tRNA epoxyqueuosine(34) reductase QueG [Anaerolineae bacterium]